MTSERINQVRAVVSDPPQALERILELFGAETGTIHVLGEDGLLHLRAWAGALPEALLEVIATIPVGKGIAGLAVERAEPVDLCNLQTDTSGQARPGARAAGVRGSICVPMMKADKAVGALGVATASEREFTASETADLLDLGRLLAEHL